MKKIPTWTYVIAIWWSMASDGFSKVGFDVIELSL